MTAGEAAAPQRRSLVLLALAYAGSATLHKGLGFVLFMWLAHSLSVADYARFGLLFALQTGVAGFAAAGISESVVGMLAAYRPGPGRRVLFSSANLVFLLLALGAALGGALVAGFAGTGLGLSALEVAMVVLSGLLSAFFTLQSLLTRLDEHHAVSLRLSFVPPLAALAGGFAGFVWDRSVTGFFAGNVAGMAAMLVWYRFSGVGFNGFARSQEALAGILSRIVPYILIVVLGWLSGYGNTYLVKAFFTVSDVARFTFAFTLASVMQLIASSLNQVWSPKFYKMVPNTAPHLIEAGNRKFYVLQGALMGALGGGLLALAPLAIRLGGLSLAPYQGLEMPLWYLFAGYAVSIPWWHVQNYYFAYSRGKELMYVVLVTSAIGLLVWVGAMQLFGSTGVYLGFALFMLLRSVGTYWWARRLWPLRLMWEGPLAALLLLGAGCAVALRLAQAGA